MTLYASLTLPVWILVRPIKLVYFRYLYLTFLYSMARLISIKLVKALNNMNLQRISSALSLKLLLRPMVKMTAFREWSKSLPVIKSLPMYASHTDSVEQSMYNDPVLISDVSLLMLTCCFFCQEYLKFLVEQVRQRVQSESQSTSQPWRIGQQGRVASHSPQICNIYR